MARVLSLISPTLMALAATQLIACGGPANSTKKKDEGTTCSSFVTGENTAAAPTDTVQPRCIPTQKVLSGLMTANPWCRNIEQTYIVRLTFRDDEGFNQDKHLMNPDGTRGPVLNALHGTWKVEGNKLTMTSGEAKEDAKLTVEAAPISGSAQLVAEMKDGAKLRFDRCD